MDPAAYMRRPAVLTEKIFPQVIEWGRHPRIGKTQSLPQVPTGHNTRATFTNFLACLVFTYKENGVHREGLDVCVSFTKGTRV